MSVQVGGRHVISNEFKGDSCAYWNGEVTMNLVISNYFAQNNV